MDIEDNVTRMRKINRNARSRGARQKVKDEDQDNAIAELQAEVDDL